MIVANLTRDVLWWSAARISNMPCADAIKQYFWAQVICSNVSRNILIKQYTVSCNIYFEGIRGKSWIIKPVKTELAALNSTVHVA